MSRKVIKARPDADLGIVVSGASVLVGGEESFFYADPKGISLVGDISILADPSHIRVATNYVFQDANHLTIPSTVVTPQPVLVANSPIGGLREIGEEVARVLSQLI